MLISAMCSAMSANSSRKARNMFAVRVDDQMRCKRRDDSAQALPFSLARPAPLPSCQKAPSLPASAKPIPESEQSSCRRQHCRRTGAAEDRNHLQSSVDDELEQLAVSIPRCNCLPVSSNRVPHQTSMETPLTLQASAEPEI